MFFFSCLINHVCSVDVVCYTLLYIYKKKLIFVSDNVGSIGDCKFILEIQTFMDWWLIWEKILLSIQHQCIYVENSSNINA